MRFPTHHARHLWRQLRLYAAAERYRIESALRQRYSWYPGGSLGQAGERLAERFLVSRGMVILAQQVRNEWGELDLIAVDDQVIVFVEVKTRRAGQIEEAIEAVTIAKQRQIARLAAAYLKRHDLSDYSVRFDVVAIAWSPELGLPPEIRHLRHAFDASLL